MAYIIYDIVIGLVLLVFALRGQKRGLVLTLCSLVAVLTAFIGANLIAETVTPQVADLLAPKISAIIEQHLTEKVEKDFESESGISIGADGSDISAEEGAAEKTPSGTSVSGLLDSLMDKLSLPDGMADTVHQALDSLQNIQDLPAALSRAIARTAAETILHLLIFLISFIVILIAWKFIGNALDLVARLPVLHFLNKTGGFALGLCKGAFFLFVVALVLKYLGGIVPEDAVDHTYLLHFFMTADPIALITGG